MMESRASGSRDESIVLIKMTKSRNTECETAFNGFISQLDVGICTGRLTALTQLASFDRLSNLCQSGQVLAQNTLIASSSCPRSTSLVVLNAVDSISAPFPAVSDTERKSPHARRQSEVAREMTGYRDVIEHMDVDFCEAYTRRLNISHCP